MVYLLSVVLINPGQMSPETRAFLPHTWLPFMHEIAGWFGLTFARSPWNASFIIALLAGGFVWVFLWYTRWGYEIRTVGANQAGGSLRRDFSIAEHHHSDGDLRRVGGMLGLNEIMGVNHRLLLNFRPATGSSVSPCR